MGEIFTNPQEWVPMISERLIDFVRCRVSTVGGLRQRENRHAVRNLRCPHRMAVVAL